MLDKTFANEHVQFPSSWLPLVASHGSTNYNQFMQSTSNVFWIFILTKGTEVDLRVHLHDTTVVYDCSF